MIINNLTGKLITALLNFSMCGGIFAHLFFFLCPGSVFCTKLRSDYTEDASVFTEGDSSFCVDITSTKDGKFITVNSNSRTSSEEGIYLFHSVFFGYVYQHYFPFLGGLHLLVFIAGLCDRCYQPVRRLAKST